MQNDSYYKIDRMSNSMMKHFKRSPRHYLTEKTNPSPSTQPMVFGSAFHCWILEEEQFTSGFAVAPVGDRRTKDGKANYETFLAGLSGHQIISADEFEVIKRMKDSLYKDKHARELLDSLKWVERAFTWKDDITGVKCKGKLDGGNDSLTIDLKTCNDADPLEFGRFAYSNYLTQPAFYLDGRTLSKEKLNKGDFYFICVEKTEPFGVSVIKVAEDFLMQGRFVYGEILSDFRNWQEQGSPDVGYEWKAPLGYHVLNLPAWVK